MLPQLRPQFAASFLALVYAAAALTPCPPLISKTQPRSSHPASAEHAVAHAHHAEAAPASGEEGGGCHAAPPTLRAPCPCGCGDAAGSASAGGRVDPPLLDANPQPPTGWSAPRWTAALHATPAPPVLGIDHVPI